MSKQSNNIVNANDQVIAIPQLTYFRTSYTPYTTSLATKNTAYFVFLGLVQQKFTPLTLMISAPTLGTGAASNALGLFSTTSAPNGTNLVMTTIVATSSCTTSATSNSVINTSAFATSVSGGTYLWAGFISNYATNSITIMGIVSYPPQGYFQSLAGQTVAGFAGSTSISPTIQTGSFITNIFPFLQF